MVSQFLKWFIIFGLAGWILDTSYRSWKANTYAPNTVIPFFSIIYPAGAFLLVAVFSFVENVGLQIVVGAFAVTLLEYVSSWLSELMLGKRLWDYSNNYANLHGRIDLLHSFFWLVLVILMRIILPYAGLM